ncbi:MAG: SRPBCC domain-containing protein [Ignavibacteriae bacterium]|nr:SRPBCC domain-containing protein [Ignavibacteriota bacterium]NOG98910.1 SRPBCC domain-containing protein [Ignavibacteriota bacterium]
MRDKRLEFSFIINASAEEVYKAWTTEEGIKSFFAPGTGSIEIKLFGDYQIYFFPENPADQKGAEDEKVLSFEENSMLSFTWGMPPTFPDLRANQKTVVLIKFERADKNQTKFSFSQSGWGSSDSWQRARSYFLIAWGNIVLPRLRYRFDVGPVDWNDMPDLSKYELVKDADMIL